MSEEQSKILGSVVTGAVMEVQILQARPGCNTLQTLEYYV